MSRKFAASTAAVVVFTGSVFAADLPPGEAPSEPTAQVVNWTGVYIGGQLGYTWGQMRYDPYFGSNGFGFTADGVVGGAHVGYKWQTGQFVLGLEGDAEGTSFSNSNIAADSYFPGYLFGTKIDLQGSIRGQVGYAWDSLLLYATGGAALADLRNTYSFGPYHDSFSMTRAGWTVGAGLEYAFDHNWSGRVEYRYTNFGTFSTTPVKTFGPGFYFNHHETEEAIRIGFSYKFDTLAAPVPVTTQF